MENARLVLVNENEDGTTATLTHYASDRYAVEFDLTIRDAAMDGLCAFKNTGESGTSSWSAISFVFFADNYARINQSDLGDTTVSSYDAAQTNRLTILLLGDQLALFVNGTPAYTLPDPAGRLVYQDQEISAYQTVTCEMDNYRLWNLKDLNP